MADAVFADDGEGGGKGIRPSHAGTVIRSTLSDPWLADADIQCVLIVHSLDDGPQAGVLGRFHPERLTGYEALYDGIGECWRLTAWVDGRAHELGYAPERLAPGTYRFVLTMHGTLVEVAVDGVAKFSVYDTRIAGAGKVGVVLFQQSNAGDGTGIYIDSFEARLPPTGGPGLD
jgi:hypothetical protein